MKLPSWHSDLTNVIFCNTLCYKMRAILNISLPQAMVADVKAEVKTGKYSTVSEFFRDLVRDWQEDQLLKDIRESEAQFKAGKGKLLHSLKDLE